MKYINSDAFRKKFNKLTNNTAVNEKLRDYAIAMLTHRKGTDGEDLYLINTDGELLLRKIAGKNEFGVELSIEEVEELRKKYFGEIIGIHNHPTNVYPTGSDFAAMGYRGYKFGIIVTHSGKVYKYTCGSKPFLPHLFDARVDKYMENPYNLELEKAHAKVLKEFEEEYGITWMEIK